ncbi:MAG: DUF3108 domain-containing protein [Balneolaceae bacterium]|nr:DUF3108 domain-containing protein [Balneolaceae bacterium]
MSAVLIPLILLLTAFPARSQEGLKLRQASQYLTLPQLLQWDEVFIYQVKYSFFKLGEIRVEVLGDTLYNGIPGWHIRGIIKSASGIPFVGKEENHYHSIFTIDNPYPRELVYWKDDIAGEKMNEERYEYDYEKKKVYALEEGKAADTLDLNTPATSGPLFFYLSRISSGEDYRSRVYMYLDREQGKVDMQYTTQLSEREYRAFERPVNTYYLEGNADIDGPFGFSGFFNAWISNGVYRLPVEAHVKVWLGNVKIQLTDYQRQPRK